VRETLVEKTVLEVRIEIHIKMTRGVDEMLKLVRQRPDCRRPHEIERAHVLSHRYVRVWHEQVEHFRKVASGTGLNRAAGSDWKEIPAEEEPPDEEVLTRRRQLVDRAREEKDHTLVVVDVGRIAEVEGIDRIDQRIEHRSEGLIILGREAVSRVSRIAHDNRAVCDGNNAR